VGRSGPNSWSGPGPLGWAGLGPTGPSLFFRAGPEPARPLGLGQNRPGPSKWLIN